MAGEEGAELAIDLGAAVAAALVGHGHRGNLEAVAAGDPFAHTKGLDLADLALDASSRSDTMKAKGA